MDRRPPTETASPVAARNAGLALLGKLRRWLVVITLALIGAFAGLVAQAKPGKSSGASRPSSGSNPAARSQRRLGAGGLAAPTPAPSISPPTQAPAPAPATPSPPVVSGGS